MLEATKDSIRLLSEATSDAIVNSLAATKSALEELYKSGVGNFPEEEIREDLALGREILQRIKVENSFEESLRIYTTEGQPFFSNFTKKYSDFLPKQVIDLFRLSEQEIEGDIKLLDAVELISSALKKEKNEPLLAIYSGLISLSEVLEQYASFLRTESLVEAVRAVALKFLTDSISALRQLNPSHSEGIEQKYFQDPEVVHNIIAIKNTARGILWQLDQAEKDRKFPVKDLIDWLDTSPGWAGDDFDECLDQINRERQ